MTDFNPRGVQAIPPVVKNIIIVNILVVIAQYVLWHSPLHVDLSESLGLHYWKSQYFGIWQFVTHIFMHGSPQDTEQTIMHIASNMIGLWIFGSILENRWGSKRFFIFYMVCGLGAALCHMGVLHYEFSLLERSFAQYQQDANLANFNQFLQQNGITKVPDIKVEFIKYLQSPGPQTGQTFLEKTGLDHTVLDPQRLLNLLQAWWQDPGSMSLRNNSVTWIYEYMHGYRSNGVLLPGVFDEATVGASGAVFGILFAFAYLFPNVELMLIFLPIPIKAKYFVAIYAAFELFSGIRNSAGDNVAHFAHLGGMLFAFILLKVWGKTRRNDFY